VHGPAGEPLANNNNNNKKKKRFDDGEDHPEIEEKHAVEEKYGKMHADNEEESKSSKHDRKR
jgi:hypothetical protein